MCVCVCVRAYVCVCVCVSVCVSMCVYKQLVLQIARATHVLTTPALWDLIGPEASIDDVPHLQVLALGVLQCVAVCCSVLQCVLQCIAVL